MMNFSIQTLILFANACELELTTYTICKHTSHVELNMVWPWVMG